jgi:hypothetical protein
LLVCLGVFLVGLVGEYFASVTLTGQTWLRGLAMVIPNIQFFWPADALTQGHPISLGYLGMVSCYATCLVFGTLSLAVLLFQTRDVG